MIRATFSDNPPAIDVKLPQSWADLQPDELRKVYEVLSSVQDGSVAFTLFRVLTGCRVQNRMDLWLLSLPTPDGLKFCHTTPKKLSELLSCLDFIHEPGDFPVRLEQIHGAKAVDPQLHGVAFGDYLRIENLYQGYLSSKDIEALNSMAQLLYPGLNPKKLTLADHISILNWMAQLKALFSKLFHNFYVPAGNGSGSSASMLEMMNVQIRALTGGDVAKEEVILASDCWRALTELDFKAKEAVELNKQLESSKHK